MIDEVEEYCLKKAAEQQAEMAARPPYVPLYKQFREVCMAIHAYHPGTLKIADDFAEFMIKQDRIMAFINDGVTA